MHRRRTSGSLGIEEPHVIEKGRWIFNSRNQANYEGSHITKCQSLLNQDIKWLEDQKCKLIIRVKYFKSQPLRVNAEVRLSVTTLMKLKRDVVTTINIMQSQVEELSFIFDLSVDMPLYQEGTIWIVNKVLMLNIT
jgi:hypothetical protein